MLINLTKCENCVKQDVCKIKDVYQYAIEAIASTNTTNKDHAIHNASDNEAINITTKCNKFAVHGSSIR
jgi:hypothetical protein